ncbi:TIGR02285 family protein [Paucibacter sp. TC2R-5]|uniref:TIGR02285 family protein n=1 Tax=Paucibacter sp. TC2R-5 TaxID=2893555 RepID=UPI0021E4138F|nr:TIGR02285 family protein [Paucibacter sp. TC2R-5]MCV2359398.1 TIGR02285 family protein [Paucibacter sp. TC2R-5]
MRFAAALALLILGACPTGSSRAASDVVSHIQWLSSDAPAHKSKGPSYGITELLIAFMDSEWPQVQHQLLTANSKRSWQMIGNGEPACHTTAVHTAEREKLAYFSDILLVLPAQLIVNRAHLAALPLNTKGEVDLPQMLRQGNLQGALVEGRSYGAAVDAAVASRPAGGTLKFFSSQGFGDNVLQMVLKGHADFTVDFDVALRTLDERGIARSQLVGLPIQGASEPLVVGIACPRNAWGLSAIRQIDKLMSSPAGLGLLRSAGTRWATPEILRIYGPRLEQFYKERSKLTHYP